MENPTVLEYMTIRLTVVHNPPGWPGDWLECRVVAPDGSESCPVSVDDGTPVRVPKGPDRLAVFTVEFLNQYAAEGWSLVMRRGDSAVMRQLDTEQYFLSRPKAS